MDELIEAVQRMRYCQIENDRVRNYVALHNRLEAEKVVDRLLDKIEKTKHVKHE